MRKLVKNPKKSPLPHKLCLDRMWEEDRGVETKDGTLNELQHQVHRFRLRNRKLSAGQLVRKESYVLKPRRPGERGLSSSKAASVQIKL